MVDINQETNTPQIFQLGQNVLGILFYFKAIGRGCGTVGTAFASHTRGLGFESGQNIELLNI